MKVSPCETAELDYETGICARTCVKCEINYKDKLACDEKSPREAIKLKQKFGLSVKREAKDSCINREVMPACEDIPPREGKQPTQVKLLQKC